MTSQEYNGLFRIGCAVTETDIKRHAVIILLVFSFFFFFKLSYKFEGSSSPNRVFCFVLIIYLFMTALGLRCCTRAFSKCGQRGLLYSCSILASHCSGFACCRAQALGLSCFNSCASRALEHMDSVVVVHRIRVAWQYVESS